MARRRKKQSKKFAKFLLTTLLVVVILLVAAYIIFPQQTSTFLAKIGITLPGTDNPGGNPSQNPTPAPGGGEDHPENMEGEIRDLSVHFIDVGQGDAIYIELPDGKNLMIDGGDRNSSVFQKVESYLKKLDVSKLDYYMLTHSDADHTGAADNILETYEVANVYAPKVSTLNHTTATYKDFLEALEKEISLGANKFYSLKDMKIEGPGYTIDFYLPTEDMYSFGDKELSSEVRNSVSPIIILEYKDRQIMFTGDANDITEEKFVSLYKNAEIDLDVDILKVAHHGSMHGSTAEFLEIVKPDYSIIMCGEGNKYGHPHSEALDRLDFGTNVNGFDGGEVYRTDLKGDILLNITNVGEIKFKFEK